MEQKSWIRGSFINIIPGNMYMCFFFLLKEANITLIVIGQSSYHHIEVNISLEIAKSTD